MAPPITTTSTTLEGQLLEVITAMQLLERDPAQNPNNTNGVTGTFNSETNVFNSAVNLPASIQIGTDGQLEVTATEYLSVSNP